MIRSEAEYQAAQKRLDEHRDFAIKQQNALEAEGLSPEEVERAMQASFTFQAQISEDIDWYEKVSRGNLTPVRGLTGLGRLLIAMRIARGWTQRELAEKLGVPESSVSRDERNEYHGITIERAQRLIGALGQSVTITVEEAPASERELASA